MRAHANTAAGKSSICPTDIYGGFMKTDLPAMGDGGNVIYVNKTNNSVTAIASLFKPKVKDRTELIKNFIEPLFVNQSVSENWP